ncbi:MAG: hypothetical protein V5A52_05865 [Halovenus sp.]|uniref:hypothetical protein n=1 Tax=Halovenus amylolytica TaxID=2500550 RepID=UPI000FE32ED3
MASNGFDLARFIRLLVLIVFVTGLFVLTAAQTLSGQIFQIAVFAVGSIAILTAMTGFLISGAESYTE